MIVDVEGKQILIMKIMIVITDGANNGWTIEGTKTRIVMVTAMTETIKLQITGKKAPTYNAIRDCEQGGVVLLSVSSRLSNQVAKTTKILVMTIVYFFASGNFLATEWDSRLVWRSGCRGLNHENFVTIFLFSENLTTLLRTFCSIVQ